MKNNQRRKSRVQSELSQILDLLNKLDSDVRKTNKKLDKQAKEIDKWDDRFFQLVKDQGSTSRTIIVAAASVIVLGTVANLFLK